MSSIRTIGPKESFEGLIATIGFVALGSVFVLVVYLLCANCCKGKPKKEKHGFLSDKYQRYKLIKKVIVSHNTRIFRFALQDDETTMGLPCGRYVWFRYWENDPDTHELEEIRRSYTPISSNRDKGYFDVMIKVYEKGKMSSHLDKLEPNKDYIEACGPVGHIEYTAPNKITVSKKNKPERQYAVTKIGLIAGGTGITPMLQLIQEIVYNKAPVQVSLIFGNVSIDDILLRKKLEAIRKEHDNIHIRFIIDKAPTDGKEWDEDVGYVTEDLIKKRLFPPAEDVVTFLCGPLTMRKVCTQHLWKLGHDKDKVVCF